MQRTNDEAPDRVALQNGTYTVSHPDHGHYVIRLHTVIKSPRADLVGRRILSLQTGPNNERDFQGVAYWNDEHRFAQVWKRFRGPGSRLPIDGYHWQKIGWSKVEKKLTVLIDLTVRKGGTSYWRSSGYLLQCEGRCVYCNRKLTVPESIVSGIGPDCAKKYGVPRYSNPFQHVNQDPTRDDYAP